MAYKDSNDWLYEEVSGRLLITSIKFVTYGKDFIKVMLFSLLISILSKQTQQKIILKYNILQHINKFLITIKIMIKCISYKFIFLVNILILFN